MDTQKTTKHIGKIAKSMMFCRSEARQYAICVSSKGIAVSHK